MAEYALGSRTQYELRTVAGKLITVEKLREDRIDQELGSEIILGFDLINTHFIEDY